MNKNVLMAVFALLIVLFAKPVSAACGLAHGYLPSPTSVYYGVQFEQWDHCQRKRIVTGSKNHPYWVPGKYPYLPSEDSVCHGEFFGQTKTYPNNAGSHVRYNYGRSKGWTWSPATSTKCSGVTFTQTSNCGFTRSATGTKNCCTDSTWTPNLANYYKCQSVRQTSNCGTVRYRDGTKTDVWTPALSGYYQCQQVTQTNTCGETRSPKYYGTKTNVWTPLANTECQGTTFTQSNTCGGTRSEQGTKTTDECCVDTAWTPLASSVCKGTTFTQTSNCGRKQYNVEGTHLFGPDCQQDIGDFPNNDRDNHPIARISATQDLYVYSWPEDNTRAGVTETFPIYVDGTNLEEKRVPVFLKTQSEFDLFKEHEAPNSWASNPQSTDRISYCLDTDYDPTVTWADVGSRTSQCGTYSIQQASTCVFDTTSTAPNIALCDECEGVDPFRTVSYTNTASGGSWVPATNTVCDGDAFTQTLSGSTCTDTRPAVGTDTPNDWAPATSTECSGVNFTQTNSCGQTRSAVGTASCGCTDTSWSPATSTECSGVSFTQTSNCGNTRSATGTGSCSGSGSSANWERTGIVSQTINTSFTITAARSCPNWILGTYGAYYQGIYVAIYGNGATCPSPGATEFCIEPNLSTVPCSPSSPACLNGYELISAQRWNFTCQ